MDCEITCISNLYLFLFLYILNFLHLIIRLIRLFRMFQRREILRIQSAFKDQLTYFILKSCVILLFFSCFLVHLLNSLLALFQQFEFNEWKPYGVHLDMITCLYAFFFFFSNVVSLLLLLFLDLDMVMFIHVHSGANF